MKTKHANKYVFANDFKLGFVSLAVSTCVVGALMFLALALFPSMKDVLQQIPSDILNKVSYDNIYSYFWTEALSIWVTIGAFYAVWAASKLSVGDFKSGSAELLYSLNLGRTQIVLTKLCVLMTQLVIFNFGIAIFAFVGLWIFGGKAIVGTLLIYFMLATLSCIVVGVLVLSWGFAGKHKFSAVLGCVLMLAFYIITSLSGIVEWLSLFSPFGALNGDILTLGWKGVQNHGLSLIVWGGLAALSFVVSTLTFSRSDIN